MKKFRLIFAGLFVFTLSLGLFAQDPPDPPGSGHGQSGDQNPGGQAPLGGGLLLLLSLGTAYGGKKVYELKKTQQVK